MDNNDFLKALDKISKTELVEMLHDSRKEISLLKNEIIENQVKVDFYDTVTEADELTEMSAVAKILNFKGMGRNKLFEFLRNNEILRHNNEPYQEYVNREYFKVIEQKVDISYDNVMINYKTMVTQKGMDFILKKLIGAGYEYNQR